jgi:tRNA threonylcarbamoyladenosine biosynthesis protein TsaB
VRIGVALVKGLAFGKNIPCVGVSALEALAENLAPLEGYAVPCMDARRSQVYTAIFKSDGDGMTRITQDEAISLDELAKKVAELDGAVYLVGDGAKIAEKALLERGVKTAKAPRLLLNENAYSCAVLAERKFESGEYTSELELAPTYLRVPQAERERLEREQKN